MRGPTCIFWANLTPCLLPPGDEAAQPFLPHGAFLPSRGPPSQGETGVGLLGVQENCQGVQDELAWSQGVSRGAQGVQVSPLCRESG
jgi:hypothetical protein